MCSGFSLFLGIYFKTKYTMYSCLNEPMTQLGMILDLLKHMPKKQTPISKWLELL